MKARLPRVTSVKALSRRLYVARMTEVAPSTWAREGLPADWAGHFERRFYLRAGEAFTEALRRVREDVRGQLQKDYNGYTEEAE